ncbi:hypothetical protein GQ457_03G031160 [Hibiscus cannabinus]
MFGSLLVLICLFSRLKQRDYCRTGTAPGCVGKWQPACIRAGSCLSYKYIRKKKTVPFGRKSRKIRDEDRILQLFVHNVKVPPPNRIIGYLREAGFEYFSRVLGGCKLQPTLIAALLERWRPETHTFHLPCGECTITLEDVSLQLGLPVKGRVVTGTCIDDWSALCHNLLGKVPDTFKGGLISLTWLQKNFNELDEDCSEDEAKAYARAYILRIIGGVLMPDKSRNQVHAMYLRHLVDFKDAGTFSWGSAALSILFREMCKTTHPDKNGISGCLLLLQSWAWYRMPFLRPIVKGSFVFPLVLTWSSDLSHRDIPDELRDIRLLIDQKAKAEFEWMPYSNAALRACIPPELSAPLDIWHATVPLICYATVEWHPTDRVLRQFGFVQSIPGPPVDLDKMHNLDRRGKVEVDWSERHLEWIMLWDSYNDSMPDRHHSSSPDVAVSPDYMTWFVRHGKPYLLSEEERAGSIHRRRNRRPPKHHRPSTNRGKTSTSSSTPAAPTSPSQPAL